MPLKKMLVLIGLLVIAGVILAACSQATATPTAPTQAPTAPTPETPYLADWQGSAHNDVASEPFRHWDESDPAEVPTSCAKCHTSAGYQDFIGADGSEAQKVDAAVPADQSQGIQCTACHNPTTLTMTSVTFPSGVTVENLGNEARCMVCHQGRESKVSVDAAIAKFGDNVDPDAVPAPIKDDQGKDVKLGFINIHYFAAGATLYGGQTHGGYEYDGKIYDSKNTHTEGYATCIGCHDQHTLQVKVEQCAACHENVATVDDLKNIRQVSSSKDYDGDGDKTEGISFEIQGLQDILYAQIQTYAKDKVGTGLVYDAASHPYFFADADGDGKADQADGKSVAYSTWTPRLLKAAYNYQLSLKDPGAFAHNPKYVIELLFDSTADLGGDVSKLARDDAGHFAGDTEPFRHWDEEGDVSFGCAKCHSAGGLPQYLENGGTMVVTSTGTTTITGVSAQPTSNGYMCSTCHDEANWPNRYAIASVTFPSGRTVSFGGKDADGKFVADDSNLCISCHQGRESTTSMNNYLKGKDADVVDAKISFKNIHYFGAGATLFGNDAQGAYQYDGKTYFGQNMHASDTGKMNKCKDCHDVHALEVKVEACQTCHDTTDPKAIRMTDVDYDGDGDVKEGISGEVQTLSDALYAEIQKYAETNSVPLVYDASSNPYFFVDADKDGKADTNDKGKVGYNGNWTPNLMKAAYNYQFSQKDPGLFAHNPKYVIQVLIDSIESLGGDVTTYTRPEVPAPAQ